MNITQLLILSILLITLLLIILYFKYNKNLKCNTIIDNYEYFNKEQKPNNSSLKLYYDVDCSYLKKGCFYEALIKNNFKKTNNILEASLIMPCTYENTNKELNEIKRKKISENINGKNIKIFMLKNTDYLVSKIVLWLIIKHHFGVEKSTLFMPYSWNLNNEEDVIDFKKKFKKDKLYIIKNNTQRQEGLAILDDLDKIINSKDKYLLVQELLQNPYLINGRKINLRIYCLFIKDSKDNVKVCIFDDGFMYYTPDLFEKNTKEFSKNITTGYIDRKVYDENPLTHEDFRNYLDSNRNLNEIENYIRNIKNVKISQYVFSQIYSLLKNIFDIYIDILSIDNLGIGFQLYGADIAIDDKLNPLLMEINKGPDLSAKDERDRKVKFKLSEDILKCIDLLPNQNNNFITVINYKKK
jgi:hypothetical protein